MRFLLLLLIICNLPMSLSTVIAANNPESANINWDSVESISIEKIDRVSHGGTLFRNDLVVSYGNTHSDTINVREDGTFARVLRVFEDGFGVFGDLASVKQSMHSDKYLICLRFGGERVFCGIGSDNASDLHQAEVIFETVASDPEIGSQISFEQVANGWRISKIKDRCVLMEFADGDSTTFAQAGDVIEKIDGQRIASRSLLEQIIHSRRTLRVEFVRAKATKSRELMRIIPKQEFIDALPPSSFVCFQSGVEWKLLKEQMIGERVNCVYSPIGLTAVLQMLRGGLTVKGRGELDRVFPASGLKGLTFARGGRALSVKSLLVHEVNDVFDPQLLLEGRDLSSDVLVVGVDRRRESLPQVVSRINREILDATDGKISGLLQDTDLQDGFRIVLASGCSFVGTWADQFVESQDRYEFIDDGNERTVVRMMNGRVNGRYLKTNDFECVAVPYLNSDVIMMLIKPGVGQKCSDLVLRLQNDPTFWMMAVPTNLSVRMPLFECRSRISFEKYIGAVGLGGLFARIGDGVEELSSIGPLREIIQSSVIEVDERGTSAASGTAAIIDRGATSSKSVIAEFDRSFLFGLIDRRSGCLLFAGYIFRPEVGVR